MKLLFALFLFIVCLEAFPQAPLVKGQGASSGVYSPNILAPNVSATKLSGTTSLIETGNKNILANPSFEAPLASGQYPSWTVPDALRVLETTDVVDGARSAKITFAGDPLNLTQDSTLYASAFADGVQGLGYMRVKTSITGLKLCARQAGTTSTSLCVDIQANSKWGLYKIPFILGATSSGLALHSNGVAVTGDVYVDDAFLGAVDLKADVDQSRIAGEAYFAGTASCTWSRTSTSIGAFTATAACPGPTIAYSSLGQWQTTDSDLPRVTVNNLPVGVYKAKFLFESFNNTGAQPISFAINDGSTTCYAVAGVSSNTVSGGTIIECTFTYSSPGNRVFEVYSAASSGTSVLQNNRTTSPTGTKFILEYFGSGSVYTSTNANTDWQSCGHTTSSFTGFGTVTNIETQCKREGGDLLMKGKFTSGTGTAVEARLTLPTWNGSQLIAKGSSVIPSLQSVGAGWRSSISTTYFGSVSPLIEPSVSYLTFAVGASTADPTTKQNGNVVAPSNNTFMINARIPIQGWENSNIIIGQFNGLESCTDSYQCTDMYSAKIDSISAGTHSNENLDFISSCSYSSPTLTCTFKTGVFTVAPNCTFNPDTGSGATEVRVASSSTTASAQFYGSNGTIVSTGGAFIHCQKQGADYIGKTAKAVASDQNLRTPGVTKAVVYSTQISSAGVVSNEIGDFISGNCTKSGTSSQRGTCTFTTAFSLTPACQCTAINSGALGSTTINCVIDSSATNTTTLAYDTSANTTASSRDVNVTCHGVSP